MTISWTEDFDSFTPGTSGAWTDYDIFTNKSVPKGAVVEIVCENANDATDVTLGVRTDGSGLNRYVELHEAEPNDSTHINMLVTVDSSTGLIEYYCSTTTNVTFYITGYWEGVAYTELAGTFNYEAPAGPIAWSDYDIFTNNSVPKGAVAEIACMNQQTIYEIYVGVRADGSALDRAVLVHEAEGTGTGQSCAYSNFVKVDDSTGIIEIAASGFRIAYYMVLGYFEDTMDYQELWTNAYNPAGDAGWEEQDISASLDEDGRVTNWVLMNDEDNSENTIGIRIAGGDDFNRYLTDHEAESGGQTGYGVTVQSDTSGIVDVYSSDTSETDFWLAGYFIFSGAAPPTYVIRRALLGVGEIQE